MKLNRNQRAGLEMIGGFFAVILIFVSSYGLLLVL